jgi:phenylacetate-CoA ligase
MRSNPEQAWTFDPIMRGLRISKRQPVKTELAGPALQTPRASRSPIATVAFELGAKIVGGGFSNAFAEMQRAQWLTSEELQDRTNARLKELLKHAAENVPFYSQHYKRQGVAPDELRNVNDLALLPILSKTDYRRHKPSEFYAANVPEYRRLEKATSGSTGEPFSFCLDRRAQPIIFASHLFYDSWHGLQPFDRYIRIVAPAAAQAPLPSNATGAVRLQRAITNRLQNLYESWTQEKISLWEVNSERAESVWRRMEAFRPKFVLGYTSTLAAIADELLQRDLRLSQPVRGVITIAETLTPNRRRLIEEYFGATIINRYGLREFGSWSAQSCAESPDRFHINTELVVCEILREDGTQCAPRERGRVVLTDLHNYARPFIRYETGDLAAASSENCTCGRGFPLLGPIEGRSLECVRTPSGNEISPAILGHFLFVYHDHLDAVLHYQLVQESANQVSLLIVPGERWDEQRHVRLRSELGRLIGDGVEVDVKTVLAIPPEKSGKRPIIKQALDPTQ